MKKKRKEKKKKHEKEEVGPVGSLVGLSLLKDLGNRRASDNLQIAIVVATCRVFPLTTK